MTSQRTNILVGVLLLAAGVLILLLNFGVIGPLGDAVWSLLFFGGGVAFLAVYLKNREQWWPIIPGMTLLGLGAIVFFSNTGLEGDWVPALLFGAIAFAFLVIYLTQPAENWWALIPAGVLASLGVPFLLPGGFNPGVFMFGMGVTFGLVYLQGLVRGLHHEFWWALIPAGVLALIGIFLFADEMEIVEQLSNLWPLVLIVIGVVVLFGAFRSRRPAEDDDEVSQADR
jgi:uncharacterized membrane protein HdeD (DUF308 family)